MANTPATKGIEEVPLTGGIEEENNCPPKAAFFERFSTQTMPALILGFIRATQRSHLLAGPMLFCRTRLFHQPFVNLTSSLLHEGDWAATTA